MTSTTAVPPAPATVRRATAATYVAFIGSGFAFASWASRIPQVRDNLHLDSAALGLVLLAIAAGSLLALPLSGLGMDTSDALNFRVLATFVKDLITVDTAGVAIDRDGEHLANHGAPDPSFGSNGFVSAGTADRFTVSAGLPMAGAR